MKPEQSQIDLIRTAFEKMQTKEQLLHLLNEAKPMVYGKNVVPYELKQLTWHANSKLGGKRYIEFIIKKKSGADRTINAPIKGLKSIQKTLSFIIQCVFEPHNAATGFVRNKSIVDNARLHKGSKYVYNIDLKDFFPSIDQARVWKCLQLKPFNLTEEFNFKNEDENDNFISKILFQGRSIVRANPFPKTREEKILNYFIIENKIKNGFYNLALDNGSKLIYRIQDSDLVIFKSQSDLDYILKIAESKSKLNSNTIEQNFDQIIEGLIMDNHLPYKQTNRKTIANIISSLCCTEMEVERKNESGDWVKVKRNVLPQGAPTSPVITNIICQRLDHILTGVAKRFGLKYSRYADDITFSSMHNVYQPESDFIIELHRIIAEQGFHINQSKTRLQKQGFRQEVTGLVVNDKVNVQKRYIKQLRMWLYYWERYGEKRAYRFFLQQYIADKGHVKNGKPDMANVISGKLDYLKMVKEADNELYLKLKSRFEKLIAPKIKSVTIPEAEIITQIDTNQVRITLEVYQSPEMNEKLNNSINIPKDTVLPSTIIVPNSIEEVEEFEEVQEDNKPNKLFPHNPMHTISFLKKFKIGDGSGFKELVHDVILSDETIKEILNKVKSHPNFIYHFKKEWISDVSFLNLGILMSVRELIVLFEKEGLPYFQNTKKHPFNNDSVYTKYAKQFKKKYRYGSGSEYSKLQTDIINIFNDQRVPLSSLSFMPDERRFNIRSSFFTWQPAIYNGIRYIVQGISDHSNINGMSSFNPNTKKILVEVERMQAETLSFVELRIFDCMSISKIDSLTLLQFFQGSSAFKFDFRNLCDWIVECDFLDESSKRLNLLNAPECSQSIQAIENLPYSVGGFKHILKFYDVK